MSTHALDSAAVVIGSKAEKGRNRGFLTDFKRPGGRPARFRPPPVVVDIVLRKEVVGEMDLVTLTRFSRRAAELFPKPTPGSQSTVSTQITDEIATSGAAGSVATVPVAQTPPQSTVVIPMAPPSRLLDPKDPRNTTTAIPPRPPAQKTKPPVIAIKPMTAPAPVIYERKVLDLDQEGYVWDRPSAEAVTFVLDWMRRARSTPRGETPPTCSVPEPPPANLPVEESVPYNPFLCELYAVTKILDTRPEQHQARNDLMNNITATLPTFDMLKHIHNHVALDDKVMKRTIHAYFDRVDAESELVDDEEITKIRYYVLNVDDDKDLLKCFRHIEAQRRNRRQAESWRDQPAPRTTEKAKQAGQGKQANRGAPAPQGGQQKQRPTGKWGSK